MDNTNHRGLQEILLKISGVAEQKVAPDQASLLTAFIQQYYAHSHPEGLKSRSIEQLAAAAVSHWKLAYERLPGQTKLRVFNPSPEADDWKSGCTALQFVTEDKPFLVDSTRMEVNRRGLTVLFGNHVGNIKVRRDPKGRIIQILPPDAMLPDQQIEAFVAMEVDKVWDAAALKDLAKKLEEVLAQVTRVVKDWPEMRAKMDSCLRELQQYPPPYDSEDVAESRDFLRWLLDDHFVFLGCRDYELSRDQKTLRMVKLSSLGVLRDESRSKQEKPLTELPPEARRLAFSPQVLVISKTNTKAGVHRPVYADYIGVKRFDDTGKLIGECRFIGLYTSTVYYSDPRYIPLIRRKIQLVLKNSDLPPGGHAAKELLDILFSLPRDDLFQAGPRQLTELALSILHLSEQQTVHLFVHPDTYRRFISCFVYLPREKLNTDLQKQMEQILVREFSGIEISASPFFGGSNLARVHFLIRTNPKKEFAYDVKEIERQLIDVARSWKEELRWALIAHYGEERGGCLIQKYGQAFPSGYRDSFPVSTAVHDIEHMERISSAHPLAMNLYCHSDIDRSVPLRFKLFQADKPIILSDVLPVLENLGLCVIDEWPQEIVLEDANRIWINDFGVKSVQQERVDVVQVKEIFQEAFLKIWTGEAENDGFNRLILSAYLTWREISILRAYTKYLRQVGVPFSQVYIENVVARNSNIAKILIQLFQHYFSPKNQNVSNSVTTNLEKNLQTALDTVVSLDEDRILRYLLEVLKATLRTNYFQTSKLGKPKNCLAFKLNPVHISDLPLPKPLYEIFVYSPRVEGVHLRAAKVARGGIRWSDRFEDFRTEILGLWKAQKVKNALIVPAGAKGGFVCKRLPSGGNRETIMNEVILCYQTFIRGLLDLTDNLKNGTLAPPHDTVCRDTEDPYLVVAADKGTAEFSDIANAIAAEYDFWLGDAFASGGSVGYDHKRMGITARGAWKSVERHSRALGLDPNKDDFTTIGIGDMSGDVFGNGLLLSRHIKLVAAFNHLHIFIDPTPDPEKSFAERQRLFHLHRSTWQDYAPGLISNGGGVFSRSQKFISLSIEAKQLLDLNKDFIAPDDLIRAILKARVDLLWNGGIGTYVKSSSEKNIDVGDRNNDALRINGHELRCRMVAEGGNLGFTQLGRIEYAQNGGLIYTDFIDNSAGVDCSDHEVNCKILLNAVVADGSITLEQRNQLLMEMTDEVAKLVLHDNYAQTRSISLATLHATQELDLHRRYMEELERDGKLDRSLEFLPDEKALIERKALGKGLASPEIAVLLAYTKIVVKAELLETDSLEGEYLDRVLEAAFPKPLQGRFTQYMRHHSLRREIVATQISNAMINDLGVNFVFRIKIETGADIAAITRAYRISHQIFGFSELLSLIEQLDDLVSSETRYMLMWRCARLIRRSARWLIYNYLDQLNDISGLINRFSAPVSLLCEKLPQLLVGDERVQWESDLEALKNSGIPETIARRVASIGQEYALLDVVEAAQQNQLPLLDIATLYFAVNDKFEFTWLRTQIMKQPMETLWDIQGRVALLDDLNIQQRRLTIIILQCVAEGSKDDSGCIAEWEARNPTFTKRWKRLLVDLRSTGELKMIMFSVVIRELVNMAAVASH